PGPRTTKQPLLLVFRKQMCGAHTWFADLGGGQCYSVVAIRSSAKGCTADSDTCTQTASVRSRSGVAHAF
ncbi:MAG: hypothetical protein AAGA22_09540, partial [Pseudomonadota bacterium]